MDKIDPPHFHAADAPTCHRAARRPSATSRGSPRCRSARRPRRSTPAAGCGRRRATRCCASPARSATGPTTSRRACIAPDRAPSASSPTTVSAASPSRSSRRWRSGSPTRASPSSCATPPTIRRASASISTSFWASASTGWWSPRGAPTSACRSDRSPHGLPVVYVFTPGRRSATRCRLLPDDEGGAALAVEHLAGLGRTRIAHVTGPEHFEAVRLRRNGYLAALADGRACRASTASTCPATGRRRGAARPSPGCSTARLSRPMRCSAATTRSPAARPTRCASGASPCPRDVAIVGFDNWDVMALAARPPLSSIDMNLQGARPRGGRPADRHDRRQAGERRPAPALLAGGAGIVRRLKRAGHERQRKQ